MTKIVKVRFTQSILVSGHSPSETKEIEINDRISVDHTDLGVTFTWQEKDPNDFHKDVSGNLVCKTFVPIHLVLQVIYEKEPQAPRSSLQEPKKAGRPKKKDLN